jgi:hypothetical protein
MNFYKKIFALKCVIALVFYLDAEKAFFKTAFMEETRHDGNS